jgi:hypothetical protein
MGFSVIMEKDNCKQSLPNVTYDKDFFTDHGLKAPKWSMQWKHSELNTG